MYIYTYLYIHWNDTIALNGVLTPQVLDRRGWLTDVRVDVGGWAGGKGVSLGGQGLRISEHMP